MTFFVVNEQIHPPQANAQSIFTIPVQKYGSVTVDSAVYGFPTTQVLGPVMLHTSVRSKFLVGKNLVIATGTTARIADSCKTADTLSNGGVIKLSVKTYNGTTYSPVQVWGIPIYSMGTIYPEDAGDTSARFLCNGKLMTVTQTVQKISNLSKNRK